MAEAPLSRDSREAILKRTIAEIESLLDYEIRKSKEQEDLAKEIRVEIPFNERTRDESVKQTIIERYLAVGWDNAYFYLETFRNETTYQVVLEQA